MPFLENWALFCIQIFWSPCSPTTFSLGQHQL